MLMLMLTVTLCNTHPGMCIKARMRWTTLVAEPAGADASTKPAERTPRRMSRLSVVPSNACDTGVPSTDTDTREKPKNGTVAPWSAEPAGTATTLVVEPSPALPPPSSRHGTTATAPFEIAGHDLGGGGVVTDGAIEIVQDPTSYCIQLRVRRENSPHC